MRTSPLTAIIIAALATAGTSAGESPASRGSTCAPRPAWPSRP